MSVVVRGELLAAATALPGRDCFGGLRDHDPLDNWLFLSPLASRFSFRVLPDFSEADLCENLVAKSTPFGERGSVSGQTRRPK